MEHRVTITIAEHGFDAANVERVLEAFLEVQPEAGPVVDADTEAGTLSITFSLDVETDDLSRVAGATFSAGLNRSGLPPSRVLNAEVEALGAAAELERDLQPA